MNDTRCQSLQLSAEQALEAFLVIPESAWTACVGAPDSVHLQMSPCVIHQRDWQGAPFAPWLPPTQSVYLWQPASAGVHNALRTAWAQRALGSVAACTQLGFAVLQRDLRADHARWENLRFFSTQSRLGMHPALLTVRARHLFMRVGLYWLHTDESVSYARMGIAWLRRRAQVLRHRQRQRLGAVLIFTHNYTEPQRIALRQWCTSLQVDALIFSEDTPLDSIAAQLDEWVAEGTRSQSATLSRPCHWSQGLIRARKAGVFMNIAKRMVSDLRSDRALNLYEYGVLRLFWIFPRLPESQWSLMWRAAIEADWIDRDLLDEVVSALNRRGWLALNTAQQPVLTEQGCTALAIRQMIAPQRLWRYYAFMRAHIDQHMPHAMACYAVLERLQRLAYAYGMREFHALGECASAQTYAYKRRVMLYRPDGYIRFITDDHHERQFFLEIDGWRYATRGDRMPAQTQHDRGRSRGTRLLWIRKLARFVHYYQSGEWRYRYASFPGLLILTENVRNAQTLALCYRALQAHWPIHAPLLVTTIAHSMRHDDIQWLDARNGLRVTGLFRG